MSELIRESHESDGFRRATVELYENVAEGDYSELRNRVTRWALGTARMPSCFSAN